MWMGVPTVSLTGRTHIQRAGLSVLSAIGLGELAPVTEDEYVDPAVRLASDLPALADLRRTLRTRMSASPLCDGPRLARELESAYRAMGRGVGLGPCPVRRMPKRNALYLLGKASRLALLRQNAFFGGELAASRPLPRRGGGGVGRGGVAVGVDGFEVEAEEEGEPEGEEDAQRDQQAPAGF